MSTQHSGNCGKCGICLTVCPVYKVLKEEHASPRARVQLARAYREKRLSSSALLKELISKCLMCGSCSAICPSGVDHESLFMEMRSRLIRDHGERPEIRSLVYLLARERRLRLAAGAARLGRNLLPAGVQQRCTLGNIPLSNLPSLQHSPFRATAAENNPPLSEEQGVVLYFTGCATNYLYPETGHATVELLTAMGYRVIIPRQQTCCSLPMLLHGGEEQAKHNILQNISCLRDTDAEAVIVDCPTCGMALKERFPELMHAYGEDEGPARALSAKVTDLMSFVFHRLRLFRKQLHDPNRTLPAVTYHTPCHLKNTFVSAERVLEALPEITYLPSADRSACCGGGGTFFYEYPEVSARMGRDKIANALQTGARIWLTDCPVCRLNLAGQLEADSELTVMHPARYLAMLLKSA